MCKLRAIAISQTKTPHNPDVDDAAPRGSHSQVLAARIASGLSYPAYVQAASESRNFQIS